MVLFTGYWWIIFRVMVFRIFARFWENKNNLQMVGECKNKQNLSKYFKKIKITQKSFNWESGKYKNSPKRLSCDHWVHRACRNQVCRSPSLPIQSLQTTGLAETELADHQTCRCRTCGSPSLPIPYRLYGIGYTELAYHRPCRYLACLPPNLPIPSLPTTELAES